MTTQTPPQAGPPNPSNVAAARLMVGVMLAGLLMVLVMGFFLGGTARHGDHWAVPTFWQGVVLVVGVGAVALAALFPRLTKTAARAQDASGLRASVMSNLVFRMAACEAPGIFGFCASMVDPDGSLVTVLIGALIALPAVLLLAWPSRRTVESLTAPARPEVRRELLEAWFPGTSPAAGTEGGITRY